MSTSDNRLRRTVSKSSSAEKTTPRTNRFRFSPVDNKQNKKNEVKDTLKNTATIDESVIGGSISTSNNPQPEVIIFNEESSLAYESNTMSIEEENTNDGNLGESQEWQQVTNRKGKQKAVEDDDTRQMKEAVNEDDRDSITSYEDINENQHDWRESFGAKKFKLWTYASRIPGRIIGEKIETVKKLIREKTEFTTVTSEVFNKQRMVSVFFDNEENLNKAKTVHVGAHADKPHYMHRAVVFKRNLNREIMYGVKLWDIPIGMKYKELFFEISSTFGEIERMNLRPNEMWQTAIIIFKEKNSAEKILDNWSIIIGDDSFRVTQINCPAANLKSRGEFIAKVVGLPIGITARELMPTIEKVGAKTCYFPRTLRTYRRKGEAIISFVSGEARDAALNASWSDSNSTTTIRIVDSVTKTCNRCYSTEHLIAGCPLTKRDADFKEKKVNSLEKFGTIYKRHNPRYFATLNKQTGNKTYADVTKKNSSNSNQSNISGDSSDRLSRIETLLLEVAERLTVLEEFVWNKATAEVEQDSLDSDEDVDMD
jgi:hypothetical protein